MKRALPGVIVSSPDAAIYSVIDLRNCVGEDFSAVDFVTWCAAEGAVETGGRRLTVLTAPMAGFYSVAPGRPNPGRTQLRVAYVVSPEEMAVIPPVLARLVQDYLESR
jgi:aspartate aminotransferase